MALPTLLVALEALAVVGLLDQIAVDLAVGLGAAGQLTSAFTIAAAISVVPLVRAAATLPARTVLIGGMAVLAMVNCAIVVAPSFHGILVLRIIGGIAASVIPPNAAALAVALVGPERRALALAWTTAGVVGAFLFGIPLATTLGKAFGWRAPFALCAVLAGLGAMVSSLLPAVPANTSRGTVVFAEIARRRAIRAPVVATLLGFAAAFTTIGFAGPIIVASAGPYVGLAQVCLGVGAVGGLPGVVRLTAMFGPRAATVACGAILVGLVMQAGTLSLGPSGAAVVIQATGLIVIGAGLFGLSPPVQAALVVAAPEDPTIALSINAVAVFLGQALGTAAGGAGIAAFGVGGALAAGIAAGTLAICASLTLPRRHHPGGIDRRQ
ncbi:MAG: MFS transporter [Acetobacteraceae bacterium]|nr:MFS transporter [Acetobacteraceae bacterium]